MPAWSDSSHSWLERPMSTGEAIAFVRELIGLTSLYQESQKYSCHSAKATVLSWMAKSNQMDFNSRRLLGHHMAADASSTLTYSRDEMIRLQAEVHLIKNAEFGPDLSRVERLKQLIGVDVFADDLIPEGEDEQYDIEMAQRREEFEWVADDAEVHDGFVMNRVSSIVHAIAADGRLMCGRTVGPAYCGIPKTTVLSCLQFCKHCEKSKLERLLTATPRDSLFRED